VTAVALELVEPLALVADPLLGAPVLAAPLAVVGPLVVAAGPLEVRAGAVELVGAVL